MPDPPYTTCAVRFSCYPLVALAEIWFSIERNTFPFSCGQWQTRVLRNRVLGAEPWADRAWQGVWRREECNPLQPTELHCTAGADWCFLHLSAPHTPTIHPCISLFIIALTKTRQDKTRYISGLTLGYLLENTVICESQPLE